MKKNTTAPKVHVQLTAYWCYGDAKSTIKVSRRRWQSIKAGAEYWTRTSFWYEGVRSSVVWSFASGEVSIDGDDGMQCVLEQPVSELIVEVIGAT